MTHSGLHRLVVGGRRLDAASGLTYRPVSPVDGAEFAEIALAGVADVEPAVAAAVAAQQANLQRSAFERADWCHRVADLLVERVTSLAAELTREHGKPLAHARDEVLGSADALRLAAEEAKRLGGRTIPARDATKLVFTTRKPRGVFVVITPFNFPMSIAVEYLGPLLSTGNAVIWKPAPSTSLIASLLVDLFAEAGLPDGLLSLLTGNDVETVQRLVAHPEVIGVGFTGGTATGEVLSRLAVGKVQLMELGGNGPNIVLSSADLELAAAGTATSAFFNSGQSCAAAGRILVAASCHAEFLERLTAIAASEVLGSPFDSSTTMGPIHSAKVGETMTRHIANAVASGARVVHGGAAVTGMPTDLYWPATVLADVAVDTALMVEETFGPIAPVVAVAGGIEEILAVANSGELGLSAAVFGRDLDDVMSVAGRLRVGQVVVNDTSNYAEYQLPFGGAPGRKSGIGRMGGSHVGEAGTEVQTVSLSLSQPWR
jgi:succinate-semialdehyde dehydrogenase/glutarate-semialdehyde dehydrogenase